MHTVCYTGDFKPVERSERRLDGLVDAWLRRDPREADGIKLADEIYLQFSIDEAPSVEELTENLDAYFEEDATPTPTVDEVHRLLKIVLGVK